MRLMVLVLGGALLLTGCAPAPQPVPPECAKPPEEPVDGGLGGTGNAPEGCVT